jgi:fucose permease
MKYIIHCLSLVLLVFDCEKYSNRSLEKKDKNLLSYVDPFIGTGGHDHTYLETTMPFGMMQLYPDARLDGANDKAPLGIFEIFYWSGAMSGRFAKSFQTRIINPNRVLGIFTSMSIILILTSVSTSGFMSMWSILAVGLFNSIIFPTIFTLSINSIVKSKPKVSGLLCTAIVGGAIIHFICGNLIDSFGFNIAFIFISLCYSYILWFGCKNSKKITIT